MRQPRNFATDRCCQIVARTANGVRQTYEYDGRGQLLAVKSADGSDAERYAYDKAGNMVRKTVGGKTTTFTFDRANQLVSSARRGLFSSALSSLWIWDTHSDLRDAIIKMNGCVNHKIVE